MLHITIRSRADYLEFLEADRLSLGRGKRTLRSRMIDDVWTFQRLMRKLEYLNNCPSSRLARAIVAFRYRRLSRMLGFSIPINVFGPGLSIAHPGTIVVNGASRVGANCRLHACVNIGTAAGEASEAPSIGDNCYLGPGAKLFGKIEIGPNAVIGANAVVNRSFPEGNVTLGGIPARPISTKTSKGLLIKGYTHAHGSQTP